jgi:hypothetical protein
MSRRKKARPSPSLLGQMIAAQEQFDERKNVTFDRNPDSLSPAINSDLTKRFGVGAGAAIKRSGKGGKSGGGMGGQQAGGIKGGANRKTHVGRK